jgi:hypothetical protein
LDVFSGVRKRDGALLSRKREEINAQLDQFPAQVFIKTEVVVDRQIVPVFRAVVHKVDTESRSLPGNYRLKA